MKRLITLISLFAVILTLLCGCVGQPYAEREIPKDNNAIDNDGEDNAEMRKLYVSGAVVHDGFVEVPLLTDRKTVLEKAGVVSFAYLPSNLNVPLSPYLKTLIINFTYEGRECQSVNVNGQSVLQKETIEGVSYEVVCKVADYIKINGKITNRSQLRSALGDDYDGNYYKFYINVDDYAQDN